MQLTVNGEPREFDAAAMSVTALLEACGVRGPRVAVMVNQEVVRRAEREGRMLAEGDKVEIIGMVGGG